MQKLPFDDLEVGYIGPALEEGSMPLLIYLALSCDDSLTVYPYNQPILSLREKPLRILSISLPFHEERQSPLDAIAKWAGALAKNEDPLKIFTEKAKGVIAFLIDNGYTQAKKIGVMGLSRGALLASLLAASCKEIGPILGFAPLTTLSPLKEFETMESNPLIQNYNLNNFIPKLMEHPLSFYIGNRDVRVGTTTCFEFISKLTEEKFNQGNRSPDVELTIFPSIGRDGHGTPDSIFNQGAHWMGHQLGVIS